MKKSLLFALVLLFVVSMAQTDIKANPDNCDIDYPGQCINGVTFGPRLWITISIPSYPNCPINIAYREKSCTDQYGQEWKAIKLEWWEIDKTSPQDCVDMYNDLWNPLTQNWDQLLYLQILTEIDTKLMWAIAYDGLTDPNNPPGLYSCATEDYYFHMVSIKAYCFAPVLFEAESNTSGSCPVIFSQVPCGDNGCCWTLNLYCIDSNGDVAMRGGDSGYTAGTETGCNSIITEDKVLEEIIEIESIYPNCTYQDIYKGFCITSCEFE